MDPINEKWLRIGICCTSLIITAYYFFVSRKKKGLELFNVNKKDFLKSGTGKTWADSFNEEEWEKLLSLFRSCTSTVANLSSVSIAFTLMTVAFLHEKKFEKMDSVIISGILCLMIIASLSFIFSTSLLHDADTESQPHGGKYREKNENKNKDSNDEKLLARRLKAKKSFDNGCMLWTVGRYSMFVALILSLVMVDTWATVIGNIASCTLIVFYFNTRVWKAS